MSARNRPPKTNTGATPAPTTKPDSKFDTSIVTLDDLTQHFSKKTIEELRKQGLRSFGRGRARGALYLRDDVIAAAQRVARARDGEAARR